MLLGPMLLPAQRSLSGTVRSASDATPLVGATVFVKEMPQIGALTDAQGSYRLSLPDGGATLVVSMLGYQRVEVPVGTAPILNIDMEAVAVSLQEVVIAAVGIEREKQSVGYAVQSLDNTALVNARETNLVNALSSKVAGVEVVSSSGSPGASANIVIRGRASLNNNSPLFVVDGVPIDNSYAGSNFVDHANRAIDINPDDIASLTVLKGPAATALYGVRAANGAIVIQTRRGSSKEAVRFSQTLSFDRVNKLPDMQQVYAQGIYLAGRPVYRGPLETNRAWGPRIDTLRYDGDSSYPFSAQGAIVGQSDPRATDVPVQAFDHAGAFFQTGLTHNTHIGITGGHERSTYYLSAGYLRQTGVVPNADFQRTTVKIAGDTRIGSKLTASGSANYIQSGGNRMQRGSNLSGVMLGLLRTPPTFDLTNGRSDPVDDPAAYLFADGTPRRYWAAYDNPYWSVNRNLSRDWVNRIIGNGQLTYAFTPWLKALYRLGIDYYFEERKSYWDNQSNEFGTGVIFNDLFSNQSINSDLLLTFDHKIGQHLGLRASAGHNYFADRSLNSIVEGEQFILPGYYDISNVSAVTFADDFLRQRRIAGVFYDIQADYRDYLYLNVTGRWDWSSTLPTENLPFFYDSYSLGFVFSEPLGLAAESAFSYGKLRLSFATVGGDAAPYSLDSYYAATQPVKGQTAFLPQTTIGNAALRPEQTRSLEGGVDLRFFRNRLALDLTFYRSVSRDQIIQVPVAPSSAYAFAIANAGEIRNVGIEAMLDIALVRTQAFTWEMTANFAANENTVVSLAPGVNDIQFAGAGVTSTANRAIPGQPFGVLYGTRWLRDDDGHILVDDAGYPLFDPQDPGVIGDPNPDWLLGWRNSFTFKGLYLSMLLDIRQGGDIYNGTVGVMRNLGLHASTASREEEVVVEGRRQRDGQPNTTPIKLDSDYYARYPFAGISEAGIEDGSWIRLREVTLSYELPLRWLASSPIRQLSLGVNLRNALLFTRYSGVDPETNLAGASNSYGRDWFNSPNTRSLGFSLQTTF
ncbi:MAG: SusC/RagA family TonB-linked outer membrane protein [Bacteroidia bacterium]